MAISDGLVALHATPQPDDLLKPQKLLQGFLNALATKVRVAAGMQQTLLCADQRPASAELHEVP